MRILIACESSGACRRAFSALGHDVTSADMLPADDGAIVGHHIVGDVTPLLSESWDMVIAHPPCTYLTNSGVRWLYEKGTRNRVESRWQALADGAEFFSRFLNLSHVPRVAIENPIQHSHATALIGRKHDQIIQPWQFGHPESKATALWLKGLPRLEPTNVLVKNGPWTNQTPSGQNRYGPSDDRWKIRSVTYQGIADAMASQWSK